MDDEILEVRILWGLYQFGICVPVGLFVVAPIALVLSLLTAPLLVVVLLVGKNA